MKSVEPVVRALQELGVSFALIGGHAVALRGHPRMTLDYDFLTTDRRVLQRDAWISLEQNGAVVDVRRGDNEDPLAGVVHIALADGTEVDVVVGRWQWEQRIVERAELLDVGGLDLRVPRTSDLILLKLAAGGVLDLQDVRVLLEVSESPDTIGEVDERIGDLPVHAVDAWKSLKG